MNSQAIKILRTITLLLIFKSSVAAKGISDSLTHRQKNIINIAAYAALGDLSGLSKAQHIALETGLSINEISEVLIHVYAYAGFPRSIRGIMTFMNVLEDRKAKGIIDQTGKAASPVISDGSKYIRGKKTLAELTKTPQDSPLNGYGAFAPTIDRFLKEHLFADIFERDILSYTDREWVTISTLSAIGGVEPMLRSHLNICLNVGISRSQLQQFIPQLQSIIGEEKTKAANEIVIQVTGGSGLPDSYTGPTLAVPSESIFPSGQKITNNNFKGTAYLYVLVEADSINPIAVGNVSFEPGARTRWHYHPAGQILMAIEGIGYYQEKGLPKRILQKGDIVSCPPNIPHWHGASKDQPFIQVALTNNQKGATVWLEHVTEEEYLLNEKIKK